MRVTIDFSGQTVAGVHVLRRYGLASARKWWCVCRCGTKFATHYRTLVTNIAAGTNAGCSACLSARLSASARMRRGRAA